MAREQAIIRTAIWAPKSGFRDLSPMGQWAYEMLVTQPQISTLGILPYTPEKWARLARGLTSDVVEAAIQELEQAGYVVVDRDAYELLVRTFITHDKIWSQWQLVKNARALIHQVESLTIRGRLLERHPWLVTAASIKELRDFEEPRTRRAALPEIGPDVGPDVGAELRPDVGPDVGPPGLGLGLGVGDSSSSKSLNFKTSRPVEESAAAENDLEPPRESRVREALEELGDADRDSLRVVLPLAQQLPNVLFEDVTARNRARIMSGKVQNRTGSLIGFLRRATAEIRVRRTTDEFTAEGSVLEWVERDARSYARGQHPWDVVEPLMRSFLGKRNIPGDLADELLEAAHRAYLDSVAQRETVAA